MRILLVVLAAAVALAGCGSPRPPTSDAASPTSSATPQGAPMTSPSPSSSSSEPPLSSVPPPTMTPPTAPPSGPSDQLKAVTLTGTATRDSRYGCILLTTDTGRFELVGDLAASALTHPKVAVVAMPQPGASSPCDVGVMAVRTVSAVG